MRRELLLLALIIILLVGCARTREYVAIAPEPYDLNNAKTICKETTMSKARMVTQFGYDMGGSLNPISEVIAIFLILVDTGLEHNDRAAFDECMKSKGWAEK